MPSHPYIHRIPDQLLFIILEDSATEYATTHTPRALDAKHAQYTAVLTSMKYVCKHFQRLIETFTSHIHVFIDLYQINRVTAKIQSAHAQKRYFDQFLTVHYSKNPRVQFHYLINWDDIGHRENDFIRGPFLANIDHPAMSNVATLHIKEDMLHVHTNLTVNVRTIKAIHQIITKSAATLKTLDVPVRYLKIKNKTHTFLTKTTHLRALQITSALHLSVASTPTTLQLLKETNNILRTHTLDELEYMYITPWTHLSQVNIIMPVCAPSHNIKTLHILGINLSCIGYLALASEFIPRHSHCLETLTMFNTQLKSTTACGIFDALQQCQALKHLSVSNNNMDCECAPNLVACLTANASTLHSLDLGYNYFSGPTFMYMHSSLLPSQKHQLRELILDNNDINDSIRPFIMDSTAIFPHLEHLSVNNSQLLAFPASITPSTSLTKLNISETSGQSLPCLTFALEHNRLPNLKHIRMQELHDPDQAAHMEQFLAVAQRRLPSLTHLIAVSSIVNAQTILPLCTMLAKADAGRMLHHITHLELGHCGIRDQEMHLLMTSLSRRITHHKNTSLRCLGLQENNISTKSIDILANYTACFFAAEPSANATTRHVYLAGNPDLVPYLENYANEDNKFAYLNTITAIQPPFQDNDPQFHPYQATDLRSLHANRHK